MDRRVYTSREDECKDNVIKIHVIYELGYKVHKLLLFGIRLKQKPKRSSSSENGVPPAADETKGGSSEIRQ